MITIRADDRRRVQIPGTKAGQAFDFQNNGGVVTLTPVKRVEPEEAFPEGSLKYLCTPERDKEMREIANAFIIGAPKGYDPEK